MAHIVFDFDSTLVSTFQGGLLGIQKLVAEYHEKPVDLEEVRDKFTTDVDKLLLAFNIKNDLATKQKLLKRFGEISLESEESYNLFQGIRELIDNLKNLGHDIYIWTARDRFSTMAILERLDIVHLFKDIRCADDTEVPKPDPSGLYELLQNEENAILIGDSLTDYNGAKSFGIPMVAATWCESSDHTFWNDHEPDFVARTPKDCLKFLKNYFNEKDER